VAGGEKSERSAAWAIEWNSSREHLSPSLFTRSVSLGETSTLHKRPIARWAAPQIKALAAITFVHHHQSSYKTDPLSSMSLVGASSANSARTWRHSWVVAKQYVGRLRLFRNPKIADNKSSGSNDVHNLPSELVCEPSLGYDIISDLSRPQTSLIYRAATSVTRLSLIILPKILFCSLFVAFVFHPRSMDRRSSQTVYPLI
jgi:hypothetical protein